MKFLTLLFCLGLVLPVMAQSDAEIAKESVDKNTIEGHIYFLADDLLKGRETGTPENKIAASYLANSLRAYGAKPAPGTDSFYQNFELSESTMPNDISLKLNDKEYKLLLPMQLTGIDAKTEAVFLNYGGESDFKNADLKGKVVLTKAGSAEATEPRQAYRLVKDKLEMAKKAGAIAVVEFIELEQGLFTSIKHSLSSTTRIVSEKENDGKMPYLWANLNGEELQLKSGKSYPVTLKSSAPEEKILKTQNVVGVIEGSDPQLKKEYIIYSAHYDHVGVGEPNAEGDSIYNGARDNAIGTTAVLSMAESMGKYPTKRSALFILFTGEEKGLLGSQYYVENPVLPLDQVAYCFNTDGGGYNNTQRATIIGLERTTAAKHIKQGASAFGLEPIDDPAPEQGLFDRSDNVSFAKKGIPAPTYSTGFDAFDEEIFKYYHQVTDEAESLDFDYLLKFYQGYIYSGRLIANDPEKPFWVKGDKYEDAGRELYQMAADLKN